MRELTAEEVAEVLARNGIGVLALYDGTRPYAIPMSFGYDGSEAVFAVQFGSGESSRKRDCLDVSTEASFTVYEEPEQGRWRSVVLSGELVEVPDEATDEAFAALATNAEFAPDTSVWGVPLEEVTFTLYRLDIDDCEGREFSMGH